MVIFCVVCVCLITWPTGTVAGVGWGSRDILCWDSTDGMAKAKVVMVLSSRESSHTQCPEKTAEAKVGTIQRFQGSLHRGYPKITAKAEVCMDLGSIPSPGYCTAGILADQLKLTSALKQGCRWALHTECVLAGLLKLKWV